MNATGLRDQQLKLYQRIDQGSEGLVKAAFLFTAWWWGRLDENRATVSQMEARLQQKLDATAEFADEAIIPDNGILVDGSDGRAWWIRGVNGIRLLRRVVVGLERITEEQFATFQTYDSASQLDGTHIINT